MGPGGLNWRRQRDTLVFWPSPTPHSFWGFLRIPGSGMRAYRLRWEPYVVGALSVPTLGRHLSRSLCVVGTAECVASGTLRSVLGSLIRLS